MNIKTEAVSLWGQPLLLMPQHKTHTIYVYLLFGRNWNFRRTKMPFLSDKIRGT